MPVDQSCCACLPALSPPCLPARQSASLPAWLPARRPVHRPAGKTLLSGGPSLVLIHPVYLDAASSLQELSTLCCLSLLKNFAHNWPLALKMLIRLLLLVPVAASPFFVLFLVAPPPPPIFLLQPYACLPAFGLGVFPPLIWTRRRQEIAHRQRRLRRIGGGGVWTKSLLGMSFVQYTLSVC